MNRITVRRTSGEIVDVIDGEIKIHEAEPLYIEFRTGRNVTRRPEVLLDGSPIPSPETMLEGASLIWRWPFCADHWCGKTNLEIISDGATAGLTLCSVPSGTKYSVDEYDRMLERLRSYGRDLDIGLAPGTVSAAPTKPTSVRATHPAVIDHYLADLLRQLVSHPTGTRPETASD